MDAEVLSALGRLARDGEVGEERVGRSLFELARASDLGVALTLV